MCAELAAAEESERAGSRPSVSEGPPPDWAGYVGVKPRGRDAFLLFHWLQAGQGTPRAAHIKETPGTGDGVQIHARWLPEHGEHWHAACPVWHAKDATSNIKATVTKFVHFQKGTVKPVAAHQRVPHSTP